MDVDCNLSMTKLFNQNPHRVVSIGFSSDETQILFCAEFLIGVLHMTWAGSGGFFQPKSKGVDTMANHSIDQLEFTIEKCNNMLSWMDGDSSHKRQFTTRWWYINQNSNSNWWSSAGLKEQIWDILHQNVTDGCVFFFLGSAKLDSN